jgi:hypothetical protein
MMAAMNIHASAPAQTTSPRRKQLVQNPNKLSYQSLSRVKGIRRRRSILLFRCCQQARGHVWIFWINYDNPDSNKKKSTHIPMNR